MEKNNQIEIIKFLKSPEYVEVVKKYNNRFETKKTKFEEIYLGENSDYKGAEPEYSELAMQARRAKIFQERINDIVGESEGANLLRKIITTQLNNTKSHLFNSVANGMGMSKDTPIYTDDDMEKYAMLHDKDFHLMIIGLMNPETEELSIQEKYDIYESPEDQL